MAWKESITAKTGMLTQKAARNLDFDMQLFVLLVAERASTNQKQVA